MIELTVPLRDPNIPIRLYLPQVGEMCQVDIPMEYAYQFPAAELVDPSTIRQQYSMPSGDVQPAPRPPAHGDFDMEVYKQELLDGGRTVRLTFKIPPRSTGIGLQTDHWIYDTVNVFTKNHWKKFAVIIVPLPEWEPVSVHDAPALVETENLVAEVMDRRPGAEYQPSELDWRPGTQIAVLLAAILLFLLPTAAWAQQLCCNDARCTMRQRIIREWQQSGLTQIVPVTSPSPVIVREPSFEPTPDAAMYSMLRSLELTRDDVLYDLGCGDGRILIAAAREYGCKGVGIEVDPQTADLARRRVREAGFENKIRIVTGDVRGFKYSGATAVVAYLYPGLLSEVAPKLEGLRVATYAHEVPGLAMRREVVFGLYPIYVSEERFIELATWTGFDLAAPSPTQVGMFQ